jgi:hypothetical protein
VVERRHVGAWGSHSKALKLIDNFGVRTEFERSAIIRLASRLTADAPLPLRKGRDAET